MVVECSETHKVGGLGYFDLSDYASMLVGAVLGPTGVSNAELTGRQYCRQTATYTCIS